MAEIQRRQAEVQKLQAAELDAVRERTLAHDKWSNDLSERLNEIGDKLDGLIGYVDPLAETTAAATIAASRPSTWPGGRSPG